MGLRITDSNVTKLAEEILFISTRFIVSTPFYLLVEKSNSSTHSCSEIKDFTRVTKGRKVWLTKSKLNKKLLKIQLYIYSQLEAFPTMLFGRNMEQYFL